MATKKETASKKAPNRAKKAAKSQKTGSKAKPAAKNLQPKKTGCLKKLQQKNL